ncbi:MAG: hypothetical protein ACO1RT_10130 [Planctomycetaceae bacterium]
MTVCLLVAAAAGCAAIKSDWTEPAAAAKPASELAAPKLDASSAALDVAFVSVRLDEAPTSPDPESSIAFQTASAAPPSGSLDTPSQRSGHEELWRWVDETAISAEVRDALRLNGLRVGRVHTRSEFTRALEAIRRTPQDEATRLLTSAAVGSDVAQASRRIPCRMGKRYELPVRQPASGEVATLVSLGGRTVGRTLSKPQPLFAITVQPSDASSVRVRIQPEIQYGAMRQTWVSSDSALRIDNRRESWTMDELAFELTAAAGDTIVAGAVLPPHGLGQQMFTGTTADGDVDHVVVVIRVADLPDMMAAR